ncbi:MAG TPA: PAS domain-containing protein [Verrucomicrobiae bacterium]
MRELDTQIGAKANEQGRAGSSFDAARESISESEKHFREMADNAPMMVWVTEPDGACTFLSESWYRFTGQKKEEGLGYGWVNAVHPDDRARSKEAFVAANAQKENFRVEYRLRHADGEYRWALDSAAPRFSPDGNYLGYIGSVIDITERRKGEKLESGQREVLELIAKDAPLNQIFEALTRMVETLSTTPVVASILVVDREGKRLHCAAGPGLPREYNDAIDGLLITDHSGSCGTAAFRKEPVIVADIANSKLWNGYATLALKHGLRACWSNPILGSGGNVLGAFAMYHREPREPRGDDLRVVEVATRTAAIAIERKRASDALRVNRERLDLVIDASKMGVWYCDLPFSDLIWDARVKEHFWLPPAARVTIDLFYERLHPEDREMTRAAIEKSIGEHSQYDIEYRTVSPEGRVRWVRAIGRGFYDAEGKPARFDGVTIDITGTKALEAELREAADRLRFMAESMPQKIFTANAQGEVTYVNRQWTDYTGRSAAELTKSGWTEVIHPEDAPANLRRWQESIQQGTSFEFEHRVRRSNGVFRWHLTRAHAMRDVGGGVLTWIGSTTDIEDQKQAEVTLEKTVAERTAKLKETIGDLEAFSYSVSHDLRSPLRAMQGYADELLSEAADALSPTHRNYLERIHRAASRLDRLTQDILSYSKLSNAEIDLHRVDVGRLVNEIIEQYPHLRDTGAEIDVRAPMIDVIGNETYLTQALSNLMNNAVKFVAKDQRPKLTIYTEDRDGCVKIVVADNGIGIERRHYDRIFQIFGRIHSESSYPGTGIGLAIVKKTAERMNGSVGFESEHQAGSRFWIALQKAQ